MQCCPNSLIYIKALSWELYFNDLREAEFSASNFILAFILGLTKRVQPSWNEKLSFSMSPKRNFYLINFPFLFEKKFSQICSIRMGTLRF